MQCSADPLRQRRLETTSLAALSGSSSQGDVKATEVAQHAVSASGWAPSQNVSTRKTWKTRSQNMPSSSGQATSEGLLQNVHARYTSYVANNQKPVSTPGSFNTLAHSNRRTMPVPVQLKWPLQNQKQANIVVGCRDAILCQKTYCHLKSISLFGLDRQGSLLRTSCFMDLKQPGQACMAQKGLAKMRTGHF